MTTSQKAVRYDINHGDFEATKVNLSLTNWYRFSCDCGDVNTMYGKLIEYLHYLRQLFLPRARYSDHEELSTAIDRQIHMAKHEENGSKLKKLRRDTARMSSRLRIVKEHKNMNSRKPKTFYRYVSKRMKVKHHMSVLRLNDGTRN